MLNNWFYAHSLWAVILAVCTALVVPALAGLTVFHRLVPWKAREHDTTMIGLSYALVGSVYAVLITFVAVGVYETMDKSDIIATEEANSLSSLAFDSAGLPASLAQPMRADLDHYIDIVVNQEWPRQRAYDMSDESYAAGWTQLRHINVALAAYEPTTPGQATVKQEMLRGINDLFAARRARILAAHEHLPEAIWQMMLCGVVLVAFYVFLFGPHNFAMHLTVTGLTMVSIGLVFSLIIGVDYPFRGDLSVGSEAYSGVKDTADRVFAPTAAVKID